jgi:hypothetical protein
MYIFKCLTFVGNVGNKVCILKQMTYLISTSSASCTSYMEICLNGLVAAPVNKTTGSWLN